MSLREALESAVNTAEETAAAAQTPVQDTPVVETVVEPKFEAKTEAKSEPKVEAKTEGRTTGRSRDEHGRLLPGKAEKPPVAETAPVVEPQVQRPPRPSSWKKEMWEHYDKLDPKAAEYIHQREAEFAKGVSTYKQDFDRAKPLLDIVGQYEPFLRQHNLRPEQFVDALAKSDQTLRFGTQQQKLQTFARLATDYQIPLHEMLVQGEDGKIYFNQQYFQPQTQAQQPQGFSRDDADKLFQERLAQMQWVNAIQAFQAAKDDKGNPKYPHFETVKQTMDGLLRAKLAPDLETAYSKSLRMHDDIWEAEQKSKQDAAQKAQQEAQAKQVAKAKAAATSVKSATPMADGAKATKGIRSSVESAVDAHSGGGRV